MIFHIIKENETMGDLLRKYDVEKEELISNNKHVTNWNSLLAGIKIRVPIVCEEITSHLKEVEPFIEDFYNDEEYDYQTEKEVFNNHNTMNVFENKTEVETELKNTSAIKGNVFNSEKQEIEEEKENNQQMISDNIGIQQENIEEKISNNKNLVNDNNESEKENSNARKCEQGCSCYRGNLPYQGIYYDPYTKKYYYY